MSDVYSFLASDKRFHPDQDKIEICEIRAAFMEMTPEEVIGIIYDLNVFLEDLAEVFRKERDRK